MKQGFNTPSIQNIPCRVAAVAGLLLFSCIAAHAATGSTPIPGANGALSTGMAECISLLSQASPNNSALVKSVSSLLANTQQSGPNLVSADPALMIVSYRKQKDGVRDVVVQVFNDRTAADLNLLNQDGYMRVRLGSDLFGSADQLLGLLYNQGVYAGDPKESQRQQRALEATLNGDVTLLREQTVEPLHVVAVMPNGGQFLPGSLRSRVRSIVLDAELTFGEWRTRIGFVTADEETAEQVGNVVAAWRELAVSLADTFAGTQSAKPLRDALQTTTVEVTKNQVVATAAVPSQTIVRASKEIAGHGGGCPSGPPCSKNKVAVCHKDHGQGNPYFTLCVPPSAVPAHLAHGDLCGPCPDSGGPGNGGSKGNNGVGNGVDPQPPGNPPVNDGPGTGPGNPGNKGGK